MSSKGKAKLNAFQKATLDNRLALIKSEPDVDLMVDKRLARLQMKWEAELKKLLKKSSWSQTEVASISRKLAGLQGTLNKLTASEVSQIRQRVNAITKQVFNQEVFTHAMLVDNHIKNSAALIGYNLDGVNRNAIRQALAEAIPGVSLTKAFNNVGTKAMTQMSRDVADAIAGGWNVDQLAKKWAAPSGASGVARREAKTLARTSVMRASSEAQRHVYSSNPEITKGLKWEATFDARTCIQCSSLHGREYPAKEAPPQPAHFNCRCTWLPVFLDEKLNNQLDTRKAYRTPDNQILLKGKQNRRFDKWLKKQPVGKQKDFFPSHLKFRAWREGKVSLPQMIRLDGSVMSDKEIIKLIKDDAWIKKATGKGFVTNLGPATPKIHKLDKLGDPLPPKSAAVVDKPKTTNPPTPKPLQPVSQPTQAVKPHPVPPKPATPAQTIQAAQAYSIPVDADDVLDLKQFKKVGAQKGSNPGGVYEGPDGSRWYVKQPATAGHVDNEIIANRLYKKLGVEVPDVRRGTLDGQPVVASRMLDGLQEAKQTLINGNAGAKVYDDLVVDAYLANWDAVGLTYDNLLLTKQGSFIRIDGGGSLLFRAQGAAKGDLFDLTKITELENFANPSYPIAQSWKHLDDYNMRRGLQKVVDLSKHDIDDIIDKHGQSLSFDDRFKLRAALKGRKHDARKRLKAIDDKLNAPKPVVKPKPVDAPKPTGKPKITSTTEEIVFLDEAPKPKPLTAAPKVVDEAIDPTDYNALVPDFDNANLLAGQHGFENLKNAALGKKPKYVGNNKAKNHYGYDLKTTGSSGHEQLVRAAENANDPAKFLQLARRAAYGLSEELPDLHRAAYWARRAQLESKKLPQKKRLLLRDLIDEINDANAKGQTYVVPPKGLKSTVDLSAGPKVKPDAPPIAKLTDPIDGPLEAASTRGKQGPIPSYADGLVTRGNTGNFPDVAKNFIGSRADDWVDGGGIRSSRSVYYQRIEGTDGVGKWVKFKWEDGLWVADDAVSSGSLPKIADFLTKRDSDLMPQTKFVRRSVSKFNNPLAPPKDRVRLKGFKGDGLLKPVKHNDGKFQKLRAKWQMAVTDQLDWYKAINDWSRSGYIQMRQWMLGEEVGEAAIKNTRAIQEALAAAPRHNATTWRGIKNVPREALEEEFAEGNNLFWNTHSSSSLSKGTAENFASGYGVDGPNVSIVFKIEGGQKVDIEHLSAYRTERESLLLAQTEYRVKGVKKTRSYYEIELEETGFIIEYDEFGSPYRIAIDDYRKNKAP